MRFPDPPPGIGRRTGALPLGRDRRVGPTMSTLDSIHRFFLEILFWLDRWVIGLWYRRQIRMAGSCSACGECCRRLILWSRGRPVRDKIHLGELLRRDRETYSRFQLVGQNSEGDLLFSCDRLGEDGLCTVHASRPYLCRAYPHPRMFLYGGSLPAQCGYRAELIGGAGVSRVRDGPVCAHGLRGSRFQGRYWIVGAPGGERAPRGTPPKE